MEHTVAIRSWNNPDMMARDLKEHGKQENVHTWNLIKQNIIYKQIPRHRLLSPYEHHQLLHLLRREVNTPARWLATLRWWRRRRQPPKLLRLKKKKKKTSF